MRKLIQRSIVPAYPGFSTLQFVPAKGDSPAELLAYPVVAWHIAVWDDSDSYQGTMHETTPVTPGGLDQAAHALEYPGGAVVTTGDIEHESRAAFFAAYKRHVLVAA